MRHGPLIIERFYVVWRVMVGHCSGQSLITMIRLCFSCLYDQMMKSLQNDYRKYVGNNSLIVKFDFLLN